MPIYFIQEVPDGAVKIGYTGGSPASRLAQLQTGNSRRLKLLGAAPGGQREERELHERFAGLRLEGEWFAPEPALMGFIDGVRWSNPDYKEETPPPWEFYGFTGPQVLAIVGLIKGWIEARRVMRGLAAAESQLVQLDDRAMLDIFEAKEQLEDAARYSEEMGGNTIVDAARWVLSAHVPVDATARLDEAISRHHAALAERSMADDVNDGVAPVVDDLLPHEAH